MIKNCKSFKTQPYRFLLSCDRFNTDIVIKYHADTDIVIKYHADTQK